MVTIEQTVDVPADRRLHLDLLLPQTVPSGRTNVVLVFPTPAVENKEVPRPYRTKPIPTIEELKAEAAAKYAKMCETGIDPWQQFRESLQGKKIFGEDGVELPDAIIAATAVALGARLVSADEKLNKLNWPGLQR
jgi:predicted nucleic acid-binding protein